MSGDFSFIKPFLESHIPNLGIQIPPASLRRFWMMLAKIVDNLFLLEDPTHAAVKIVIESAA